MFFQKYKKQKNKQKNTKKMKLIIRQETDLEKNKTKERKNHFFSVFPLS